MIDNSKLVSLYDIFRDNVFIEADNLEKENRPLNSQECDSGKPNVTLEVGNDASN